MALVLDTAYLPPSDRAAAFDAILNNASVPTRTERVAPTDQDVYARVSFWQLGPGVDQIRTETSAFRFVRSTRHVRRAAPERISLAFHLRGRYVLGQGERDWADRAGELHLLDLNAPYRYATVGDGAAQGLHIDYDQLGLPIDLVRRAAPRLTASPVYDLVRAHLLALPAAADGVEGTSAAGMLGASTVELARALIASAAEDDGHTRSAMASSLQTRIDTYLHQHVRDPALDPERIAAAHNISVRYLHRLFEDRRLSVTQTIITARLDGVRRDLATRKGRTDGVGATARRWGFTNASHFARRFRAAYGITAQEWVEHNRPGDR